MTNIIKRSIEAADFEDLAHQLAETDCEAITAVYDEDADIVRIESGFGDGTFHQFESVPSAEEIREEIRDLIEVEAKAEAA